MNRFIKYSTFFSVLAVSGMAFANVTERIKLAFDDFRIAYQALPSGVCDSSERNPVRPYRVTLEKLRVFEVLARDLSNRPDLSAHRRALEQVVDSGQSPCVDRFAGVSFRCDGDCPRSAPSFVEVPKLRGFAAFSSVDGFNVSRVVFDNGGWIQLHASGDWYEFDRRGNRIFRFKELERSKINVLLNDESRNLQLMLDLRRKQVSFGINFGPRQNLYRIRQATSR